MAFHLVTRILEVGEASARGTFRTPASGPPLSPCLVAEAIGQLAAWAAMSRFDFAIRPIAGIASEVEFFAPAPADASVDLTVAIDRLDETALAYGGSASQGGRPLLDMRGCVGPMMPMAELENPAAARARFARLSGEGEVGLAIAPDEVPLEPAGGTPGKDRRARLRVPDDAPYFADHFPSRPVFPGTLLLDAEARLAHALAREAVPAELRDRLTPRRARGVKFRSFLVPGDVVELDAAVVSADVRAVRLRLGARHQGRRAGDSRIEIAID